MRTISQGGKDDACPRCREIDRTQSVRSIVSGGTTKTVSQRTGGAIVFGGDGGVGEAFGTSRSTSTSATLLAKALAPPIKPQTPRAVAVGLVLYAIFPIIIFLCCGAVLVSGVPGTTKYPVVTSLMAIAAMAVCLGILVALFFAAQRVMPAADERHEQWRRQVVVWPTLYYCWRCDLVYDPTTGKKASPDNMARVL